MKLIIITMMVCWLISADVSLGESPENILQNYEVKARAEIKDFKGFLADRGRSLYMREERNGGSAVSCSSCHTPDPTKTGRTRANKDIKPLAPSANAKRFTNLKHVEKWFARNCDDVLKRDCTLVEKGDFMTYLLSTK